MSNIRRGGIDRTENLGGGSDVTIRIPIIGVIIGRLVGVDPALVVADQADTIGTDDGCLMDIVRLVRCRDRRGERTAKDVMVPNAWMLDACEREVPASLVQRMSLGLDVRRTGADQGKEGT